MKLLSNAQAPSAVVMIRPHCFTVNPQTQADNSFQSKTAEQNAVELAQQAFAEVSAAAEKLRHHGIKVHLFEDETTATPDSVFPNNWFSTHPGGQVAIYPMYPVNRRLERRTDVIEMLKRDYRVHQITDYSGLEMDNLFLEGTGSMVLDHVNRVAYAAQSNRTNPLVFQQFCTQFNYEPMLFEAFDINGDAVYHTNVIMCVATEFVLICLNMISNNKRRAELIARIEQSGREVIDLTYKQIDNFAGNALELQATKGRVLALSSTAEKSLTELQRITIGKSATLLPLQVTGIEQAGGSVRCMLAGIHLSAR